MAETQFTIQIQNLNELLSSLKRFPTIVAPRIVNAINKALAILAKNGDQSTFQFKTPSEFRTNYLQSTWGAPGRGLSLATPASLTGKIWTNAGYAIYVHEGTAPHTITVRVKKVLANVKMGKIFGKVVQHPGTAPNKFIPRIISKSQSEINLAFMSALSYIARDLAGNASP